MAASILRLASLVLVLILPLFVCTEYAQGQGYYDQQPPGYYDQQPPGYYDQQPPGYYGNPYQGGGGGRDYRDYEKRRKQVLVNCNIGWQNCMNVCNTIQNAQQRNACIHNCNHARRNCLQSD